jgi:hypothetical protein
VFHERDDNLVFCPILYVLALAFADNAFASEWINCLEDLEAFQVPSHLQSLLLSWKESMLEVLVFRRAVSEGGQIVTSSTLVTVVRPLLILVNITLRYLTKYLGIT